MTTTEASRSILIITGTWPPMACGVGDYSCRLAMALERAGADVHVVTSVGARPPAHTAVRLYPLVDRWSWGAPRAVTALAATLQPEVIVFQWPTAAYGRSLAVNLLPWLLKRRLPGVHLTVTLHELRYFKPWTRWRLLPALRAADTLIAVDPLDLPEVLRLAPGAEARLHAIPIGSNVPAAPEDLDRDAVRARWGWKPEHRVVAFFGFANPPKGLERLFAALAEARQRRPEIRFLFFSAFQEHDAYHRALREAWRRSGLEPVTVIPGYQEPDEAAALLASADCAALPFTDGASRKRGSLLACLAQGLAVITTEPLPGAEAPFRSGEQALTVPRGDTGALVAALERVCADPALRRRLGRGAREAAAAFSWEQIADHHLDLWGGRRPGGEP